MQGAEQVAGKNALTSRKSSWRRKNESPTAPQRGYASSLGLTIPGGTTKPQLSDMITVRLATWRLDPKLPKG